jgi:hypothetical protein
MGTEITIAGARSVPAERQAQWLIALGALMVACGGLLLGVQVDANRGFSGTGYSALALGGVLALAATIVRARGTQGLPRDGSGACAAIAAFLGLSFAGGSVLAPGGPWMLAEFAALLVLALRRPRDGSRWVGSGALWLMVALFLFRLWITYQGSRHHWQVLSIPIPVLSWLPFDFLEPIQSVSLGSFTPDELGLPPAGLDFPITLALWSAGFALCAAGLFVVQLAAREHENDRVHDLIRTLPGPLAGLVERLLPEEEWESLGLHGQPTRLLCKRIEALVRERAARQREVALAFERAQLLSRTHADDFSGAIQVALAELERRPGERREKPE